jgi:hypothetical protein
MIKAGSHTRLERFEKCNYWAKLSYIDKIPEPERPLPPGKTEQANDRGTRIHEAMERYIKGGVELIPELESFATEIKKAREVYAAGKASTEGEWAFTKNWEPVAWMSQDVYIRIKCDLVVWIDPTEAVVVDLKSGKRFGNEIKHGEQMQLYAIGTVLKYPKVKKVTTELWYSDIDELKQLTYTREQALRFVPNYERRLNTMIDARDFPPSPNVFSCKWCPYKPVDKGGTGHCKVGV